MQEDDNNNRENAGDQSVSGSPEAPSEQGSKAMPRPSAVEKDANDATRHNETGTAKRSRRRGCLVPLLAVLGAGVLIVGVAITVALIVAGVLFGGKEQSFYEKVVSGETGHGKIAVINVHGMIVSSGSVRDAGVRSLRRQLERAKKDQRVAAVILDMNTPGGEVTASDEIYHQVSKFKKPVITCMHGMGASGGYMIAAGSDYIVANRLSLTGSIGVIMGTLDYSGFLKEHDVEMEVYKSGQMKDILSGARERTESEKEYLNSLVHYTFKEFTRIVAENREAFDSIKEVMNAPFADGRVMTGKQALEAGLIDQCGYFRDAVRKARELGGAPNAAVVRYKQRLGLQDLLFSVKQNVQPDLRELLPTTYRHLRPGGLYYLMPTAVDTSNKQ